MPYRRKRRKLSDFETRVKAAPPEVVLRIKAYFLKCFEVTYEQSKPFGIFAVALKHAAETLDTDPANFLNVNRLWRDLILEALTDPRFQK